MCGIAGWISTAENLADSDVVCGSLAHRGPDSSGVASIGCATLFHTRLRVIDLTDAGHQPAWSEDRSIAVVFNGEIYNHRELRAELEKRGHRFRGHADTEVIAPLYEEHGERFVERLRGMFAIALYDDRRNRLLLCRDRFGIKPLFWARCTGGVAFASELLALRLVDGVDLSVDPQAISDFVSLHHIPPPQTMHRGIRALEPGTVVLAAGREPEIAIRRYHQWSIEHEECIDPAAAVEEAGRLLDQAVASQLESDVPLGGMLSGGIDSGLVCHAAHQATPDGISTFGVSFDDPAFDERSAFEAAATSIGTTHRTLRFGSVAARWDDVQRILLATGQPFADTSILAVDALSAKLREHVTVALSGDGGDEAFAGYEHFGRMYALAPTLKFPRAVRGPILRRAAGVLEHLPEALAGRLPKQLPARLRDLGTVDSLAAAVADQTSWIRAAEHAAMWVGPRTEPSSRLFEPRWPGHTASGPVVDQLFDILTEADVRIRLAGDYLPKVDIASMRHSLEVRVPMLDEDLFAFGLGLPRQLKRPRNGQGKLVLRELAAKRIPAIARLPKRGFGVPFDHWVDDTFRSTLADFLAPGAQIDSWIDPAWSRVTVEAFRTRTVPVGLTRQGLYQRVFMLMALETHLSSTWSRHARPPLR